MFLDLSQHAFVYVGQNLYQSLKHLFFLNNMYVIFESFAQGVVNQELEEVQKVIKVELVCF